MNGDITLEARWHWRSAAEVISPFISLQFLHLFLLNAHHGNWHVYLPTKFDRNRIILGWDMEIMQFSKWRPSAILNLRKTAVLVTWPISSCDPSSLHQISRWSANMAPRYNKKNDFQYGVRPTSWICYDVIILHSKTAFSSPTLC